MGNGFSYSRPFSARNRYISLINDHDIDTRFIVVSSDPGHKKLFGCNSYPPSLQHFVSTSILHIALPRPAEGNVEPISHCFWNAAAR